ncbi:MAG: hypothetical protein JXB49_03510 [Bacteroidales bacterium]|nr:hypothetical protein [Bacteroidales bacterium]
MPVSWIDYKGRKILYADYRGLKTEDAMLQNLRTEADFYAKSNFKILSLNDYRDSVVSNNFMNKVTELGKATKDKTDKAAVLGITGLKKILINGYASFTGQHVKVFENEITAKEYLVT